MLSSKAWLTVNVSVHHKSTGCAWGQDLLLAIRVLQHFSLLSKLSALGFPCSGIKELGSNTGYSTYCMHTYSGEIIIITSKKHYRKWNHFCLLPPHRRSMTSDYCFPLLIPQFRDSYFHNWWLSSLTAYTRGSFCGSFSLWLERFLIEWCAMSVAT